MSYSISFAGYNQRRRITRSVINWFINHQGIDRFNIFIDIIDRRCRNTDGCNGTCTTTGDLSHTLAAAKFGSLTLSTDLAVAEGGTGVSTFTDNGILYGDGSNALDVTAAPGSSPATDSYQILTATSGGVPVWTTTIDGGTY